MSSWKASEDEQKSKKTSAGQVGPLVQDAACLSGARTPVLHPQHTPSTHTIKSARDHLILRNPGKSDLITSTSLAEDSRCVWGTGGQNSTRPVATHSRAQARSGSRWHGNLSSLRGRNLQVQQLPHVSFRKRETRRASAKTTKPNKQKQTGGKHSSLLEGSGTLSSSKPCHPCGALALASMLMMRVVCRERFPLHPPPPSPSHLGRFCSNVNSVTA